MIIIIKRCKNNAEPSQEESILFGQECPLHAMADLRSADEVISKIQKAPERIAAGSMSDEMCPIKCSVHTSWPEKGCA